MAKRKIQVDQTMVFDEPQATVAEYSVTPGSDLRTFVSPQLREVCERNARRLAEIGGYNPRGFAHDKHGNKI